MHLNFSSDVPMLKAKYVVETLVVKNNDVVIRRVQLKVSYRSLDSEELLDSGS